MAPGPGLLTERDRLQIKLLRGDSPDHFCVGVKSVLSYRKGEEGNWYDLIEIASSGLLRARTGYSGAVFTLCSP